ncbi:MAG: hypothetical protein IJS94_06065, partial [Clostridia bacterium]|nr:hypothetical protein [Clostridia bacterium]
MSTAKKQIIITLCIALLAAAAIVCTILINNGKTDPVKEETETHLFSDDDAELIRSLEKDVSIYVFRSEDSLEKSQDTAEISYRMMLNDLSALNDKIKVNYLSGSEASSKMKEFSAEDQLDCTFVCGNNKETVKYADTAKFHTVGKKVYALDRSLILKGLCNVCGTKYDGADDRIAVTSEYDKDGDAIGSNLRAFIYPSLERKDVKRIAVTNRDDTYFAYKAANDSSFVFAYDAGNGTVKENGEPEVYTVNTSYDASMTSSLIVSSIYTLSTSKINGAGDTDYGLADKSKASLIIEVFTASNEYHVIVVGDKTPSGNGYFAKYYYLYAKGALGSDDYVKMLQKASDNDNIAKYTYGGKQFSGHGAEFYTKPFVYTIGTDIETAALHPLNDYLTGELVYTVSDQQNLYTVDDIRVNFISRDEELV